MRVVAPDDPRHGGRNHTASMLLRGGYKVARQRVIDDFERTYMVNLLEQYTTLAAMSRVSGVSSQQLRMLMEKHSLTFTARAGGPR